MSEDFFDSQSATQEKPAETKTRKRRERPEPAVEATPAKPDRERKRRTKNERKPRETKVSIGVAITAFAGLSEDEAKIVSTIAGKLGEQPKKSRERIVVALGNLFA